ncbi:MAG: hypothetical protein ACE5G9_01885 [Nitrospinales bacterium]
MRKSITEDYGIQFNKSHEETLKSSEAEKWRNWALKITVWGYKSILERTPDQTKEVLRLDYRIVIESLNSAYLGLQQFKQFHKIQNHIAPANKAAAYTCWINRFCPIQFTGKWLGKEPLFYNSILALEVGYAIVIAHQEAYAGGIPISEIKKLPDTILGHYRKNSLIYALMWRNPSFKELQIIFELLTNSDADRKRSDNR